MPTAPKADTRVVWIVPEKTGGIRTYAEGLLRAIRGMSSLRIEALWELPDETLFTTGGDGKHLVHLHHEFGFFGSKIPGRYRFPRWIRSLKGKNPNVTWVATAHFVIDENYRFPLVGKDWWSIVPRILVNTFLISSMRKAWTRGTWSNFDGVIVHSKLQVEAIVKSGCEKVVAIPLPVPKAARLPENSWGSNVTLFGYFSPDKGQDIAIRAWSLLGDSAPKLILAGGVRRKEDEKYADECRNLIKKLGLENRIEITGYVPEEKLDSLYRDARLVIAPFRITTGSASIAAAFARAAAVLASDLPLNRELVERVPGCLAFFKTDSANALADAVRELFEDRERIRALSERTVAYADLHTPERMASLHLDFYKSLGISN
jgi:glycosyltransferase involved in cell wall biosynthesis